MTHYTLHITSLHYIHNTHTTQKTGTHTQHTATHTHTLSVRLAVALSVFTELKLKKRILSLYNAPEFVEQPIPLRIQFVFSFAKLGMVYEIQKELSRLKQEGVELEILESICLHVGEISDFPLDALAPFAYDLQMLKQQTRK